MRVRRVVDRAEDVHDAQGACDGVCEPGAPRGGEVERDEYRCEGRGELEGGLGAVGLVSSERGWERGRADVPLEGRAGERGVDRRDRWRWRGNGDGDGDTVNDGSDWYGRTDEHVARGDEDGGRHVHEAGDLGCAAGDVVGRGRERERPANVGR